MPHVAKGRSSNKKEIFRFVLTGQSEGKENFALNEDVLSKD